MNLQSPTSLLNSIHSMRDKLRNDKELLSDIKHGFSKMQKKKRPPPIETILEQSVQDPSMSLSKQQHTTERGNRSKMIQLKKQQQRQMSRLKQEHQKELQILMEKFTKEKEEIQESWKAKFDEQTKYISILEEQVSSPIQTERQNASSQQYDAVINQLLQENTRLHQQLQNARDQSEHWRKQAKTLWTQIEAKTRAPLFNRNSRQKLSKPQKDLKDEKEENNHQVESIYADENIDRSNMNDTWSDMEINNDQGKMKTIKQFPLGLSQAQKSSGVTSRLR